MCAQCAKTPIRFRYSCPPMLRFSNFYFVYPFATSFGELHTTDLLSIVATDNKDATRLARP